MSSVQCQREFLTAAEQTTLQDEEEREQQRRLLDVTWRPLMTSTDLPQQPVEEQVSCSPDRKSSLDRDGAKPEEEPELPGVKEEQQEPEPPGVKEEQQEPEPPGVKEEQQEVYISQQEEQLDLKQETDTMVHFKSENDEPFRVCEDASKQDQETDHQHKLLESYIKLHILATTPPYSKASRKCSQQSTSMEQIDECLAEEVRRYEHLYNPSLKDYKDSRVTYNSWKEIAGNVGLEVGDCMKKWRKMRDKFVRIKKTMKGSSGDAGRKLPAFYIFLSWLEPHVRHRETASSAMKASSETEKESSEPLSVESTPRPEVSSEPSPTDASSAPEHVILPSASAASSRLPAARGGPAPVAVPPPLSRRGQKKKRQREQDDCLMQQMAQLEKRRLELQKKLSEMDEFSRFGQTVADMLRRVPEKTRPQAMCTVYNTLFEYQQRG